MKRFFRNIPRPPLTIVIILLAAAVLLACGPATQSSPSEQPVSQPALAGIDLRRSRWQVFL